MAGCPIKRILTFKEAVVYSPIKIIDETDKDVTLESMYSWSTDGVCWTNWVSYDQYISLAKNIESDFFLRILIMGGLKYVYFNNSLTHCYSICLDQSNVFLKSFCESENLFQPYQGLDCAILLQQQTADSIVCMFGIPIYYIRVVPNKESVDYTFKEWVLHNVVDIKQLKLMIADGQMPSSNPKLTDFDFDWEVDWETELSKNQFAAAFGDTAFPKQRDLIYIPMMKRLWEVNSAYDEKNESFMWRPTTWKLSLVKYNEKTNVDKGDFEDLIDGWMVNKYEDTFGEKEHAEQERKSGSDQLSSPTYAATNLFEGFVDWDDVSELYNVYMEDAVRKQITKNDISIQDKMYCNHSNIVARNVYRFKNNNGCVVYQKPICGPSGWLSFIIETPAGIIQNLERKLILKFGQINVYAGVENDKFYIECGNMKVPFEVGYTYMVLLRWSGRNRTVELTVYPYVHEDRPVYLLKPEMYWWKFEEPIYTGTESYFDELDKEGPCVLRAWPFAVTNIKYYRGDMSIEDMLKETIKYTTNHEQCVINDLARPLFDGHGYAVR